MAARYADASLPQKSQFLRPRAKGLMTFSIRLLSRSILPSFTKDESLGSREKAYFLTLSLRHPNQRFSQSSVSMR